MPSSATYLKYILDQLSGLLDITYRAMMGEFLLYDRGKLIGGIYDDRLLVKSAAANTIESASPLERCARLRGICLKRTEK